MYNNKITRTYCRNIAASFAVTLLVACGSDGGGSPSVGSVNVINSEHTGGVAAVVTITGYDQLAAEDAAIVFNSVLTYDCTSEWSPSGSLCDEAPTTHDNTLSTTSSENIGATFYVNNAGDTGVLIVDACNDLSCGTVSFSEARIFQMFSDGKTTHARLAVHADIGDTPPAWDDAGWAEITSGFVAVGAGATADLGLTVSDPSVFAVGSQTTRYVRVEVMNDGTHGGVDYIELRSIKLF